MSTTVVTGLFTVLGVIVGAAAGVVGQSYLYRRQRKDALNDRLYGERSTAYITFLQAAHDCAVGVGRLAWHGEYGDPDRALASPEERVELAHLPDKFAAKYVRVVEMMGPPEVAAAATRVQSALYELRNELQNALAEHTPVEYWSGEYQEYFQPYRNARAAFVASAKEHLAQLSERSGSEPGATKTPAESK